MKASVAVSIVVMAVGIVAITRSDSNRALFHGYKTNPAVEQRSDSWWQDAHKEVAARPANFRTSTFNPFPALITHGNLGEKVVALTFDDGPHPSKVEELLGLLKQLRVKATFFVIGKMVEQHPELVRMEAADGHEIGNHSFSHVDLAKLPESEVETEYLACSNLLKHVLGYAPEFCRPPGGQATPAVIQGASRCGLSSVMWTDDPRDYSNPGDDVIAERLLRHVSNGGILLLHEGVDETMDILPAIVNTLRSEGYQFVTMSELAAHLHSKAGQGPTVERSFARIVRR